MWPAVTLIGFLLLTALVIALGASSTARYEAERNASPVAAHRRTDAMANTRGALAA